VRKDHNALGSQLKWAEGAAVVSRFPDALLASALTK
jgi:hypothetical protein